MFKWLFKKPKPAEKTEPSSEQSVAATAPVVPAPAAASEAPPVAPVTATVPPASVDPTSEPVRSALQIGIPSALRDIEDRGVPAVGMSAVALSESRAVPAKIIKIQAGGRRIVARLSKTAVQTYSRRTDGRYWLEGAPAKTSRRLVLGTSSI